MIVETFLDKGPEFLFCCEGARRAWDADALVIVPEPHAEDEPIVFTAAIDYEGGSALRIDYCPFCAAPVTPAREKATASEK